MRHKLLIGYISTLTLLLVVSFIPLLVNQIKTASSASENRASVRSSNLSRQDQYQMVPGNQIVVERQVTPASVLKSPKSPATEITPVVSIEQCSANNGLCLSDSQCADLGGSPTGGRCASNPQSPPLSCCMLRSQNQIDPNKVILQEQCSATLGGQCMTGNDCSSSGGTSVGNCWDGGITSLGVCCVSQDQLSETMRRSAPDPRQCEMYHFPAPPIFCHQCGQKFCSKFAANDQELLNKCGGNGVGSKQYKTECCYDANLDGQCDAGRDPGYCCKTCYVNPFGPACP